MDMGKQVGPLPMGAWVVVVGAGLGFALWQRKSSQTNPGPTPVADPNVGAGGIPGSFLPVVPPTGGVEPDATTNEQWANKAIRYLIGQGYPPAGADIAVRRYLAAMAMSPQEQAMMSDAIGHIGPPPQPLPPPTQDSTPPPVTPPPVAPPPVVAPPQPPAQAPPPPPAQARYFTVARWPAPGSSLWSIASIMYGNPLRWTDIYNANRDQLSNPNVVHPGQRLRIP